MSSSRHNQWQKRYDKSIRKEQERIEEAEANESEWEKLLTRATYTGTILDLLLLPIVLVVFGLPALVRHLRR